MLKLMILFPLTALTMAAPWSTRKQFYRPTVQSGSRSNPRCPKYERTQPRVPPQASSSSLDYNSARLAIAAAKDIDEALTTVARFLLSLRSSTDGWTDGVQRGPLRFDHRHAKPVPFSRYDQPIQMWKMGQIPDPLIRIGR